MYFEPSDNQRRRIERGLSHLAEAQVELFIAAGPAGDTRNGIVTVANIVARAVAALDAALGGDTERLDKLVEAEAAITRAVLQMQAAEIERCEREGLPRPIFIN